MWTSSGSTAITLTGAYALHWDMDVIGIGSHFIYYIPYTGRDMDIIWIGGHFVDKCLDLSRREAVQQILQVNLVCTGYFNYSDYFYYLAIKKILLF
jgi:hypothetical protein